jgi:magnesium-transporting ATPase (P-type)
VCRAPLPPRLVPGIVSIPSTRSTKNALTALHAGPPHTACVLRDGALTPLPATELVPGDVIVLREGFEVPADARLLTSSLLEADESRLTGATAAVGRQAPPFSQQPQPQTVAKSARHDRLRRDLSLPGRDNMVFAGSVVTRGGGRAVVVQTGRLTEWARRVAEHTDRDHSPQWQQQHHNHHHDLGAASTPLQATAAVLTVAGVAVAGVGAALTAMHGAPWELVLLLALVLLFTTTPSELPVLGLSVLATGAQALGGEVRLTLWCPGRNQRTCVHTSPMVHLLATPHHPTRSRACLSSGYAPSRRSRARMSFSRGRLAS